MGDLVDAYVVASSRDPFGRTAERKLERQMIADYEAVLDEIEGGLTAAAHATAVALARQPLSVKGFGHVKLAKLEHIKEARQKLLTEFRTIGPNREARVCCRPEIAEPLVNEPSILIGK